MKKLTDKQKLEAAIKILKDIHTDSEMALCEDWDKSDSGFECQRDTIARFFEECGIKVPEYKPETN